MKKTVEKQIKHNHEHHHAKKKPLSHEEKQVAAYYLWQERGRPIGDDFTDWERVEKLWEDEDGNLIEIMEEDY